MSNPTPIYLAESDLTDLLDFNGAIDVLEDAFCAMAQGEALNQQRTRIPLGTATYNLMSAGWPNQGVVGLKAYTVSQHGAPMNVMLHNSDGSGLLAVMSAGFLSGLRTGGVSGLSARHMAADKVGPVGVIGAGFQAAAQVRGIAAATGTSRINVYARNAERRTEFCARMAAELGIEVVPVASVEAACADARVLVTITNSADPVIEFDDVEPGTHVVAAGNNTWKHSEIDPRLFERAATIAVDDIDQARAECGELMRAADRGLVSWSQVRTLGDVVTGTIPGRTGSDEITIFEWQGIALADVAVAVQLYRLALDEKRGIPLG